MNTVGAVSYRGEWKVKNNVTGLSFNFCQIKRVFPDNTEKNCHCFEKTTETATTSLIVYPLRDREPNLESLKNNTN